jgi:hypothetical protein
MKLNYLAIGWDGGKLWQVNWSADDTRVSTP